ncbi:MAG: phosphate-binding protein, partial [Campylobacterota bacterium]|nr:phosphate-binding protein [Campylobacterota bacterium]
KQMKLYKDATYGIRKDGAYIPSGENDNLIIQKLKQDRDAIGIFGYNFLLENDDKVSGIAIDGIYPTQTTIAKGSYPITRQLYLYVNIAHLRSMPSLQSFLELFFSQSMLSPDGLLVEMGLVPLLENDRVRMQERIKKRLKLTLSDLKEESR